MLKIICFINQYFNKCSAALIVFNQILFLLYHLDEYTYY